MVNPKRNLKNKVRNAITFLYLSINGVDQCDFWMAYTFVSICNITVNISMFSRITRKLHVFPINL